MDESYRQLQIEGSDWSYGSKWGDLMEEAILEMTAHLNKDASLLDIGCGEGRGLDALKLAGFTNLFGCDISPEKINRAREKGFTIYEEDFHTTPSIGDKSIDYVFSSHTLEHAYDLELAFKNIGRITKSELMFVIPIGERLEDVRKKNPSHTSPIFKIEHLEETMIKSGLKNFVLKNKMRMCPEAWGWVYFD